MAETRTNGILPLMDGRTARAKWSQRSKFTLKPLASTSGQSFTEIVQNHTIILYYIILYLIYVCIVPKKK